MNTPAVRGIICDLDGVLVDTENLHARAWAEVFIRRGNPVPDGIDERFIGVIDDKIAETLIKETSLSVTEEEILREKREIYKELLGKGLEPLPGVEDILDDLSLIDTLRSREQR